MTICRSCVVCAECLDDALEHEAVPRFGIVGGATARRRNELARHRRLATAGPIDELEAVETIVSTITAEPVVVRMRLAYAAAL